MAWNPDRLMQPAQCVCFGVEFQLQTGTPALMARLRDCVPYGTELRPAGPASGTTFTLLEEPDHSGATLLADQVERYRAPELERVLLQLRHELMLHVALHAPAFLFIHAGVVGWRGRALVFPGFSFAGKSTLVAELVKAGATYYSDECALIDAGGLVHPYARPLQLRAPGSSEQTLLSIEQLSGRTGSEPLPVAQVIFADYQEHATWSAEPLSPGNAVLGLMQHTIPVKRKPARVMETLTRMIRGAGTIRATRGEARDVARALLDASDLTCP